MYIYKYIWKIFFLNIILKKMKLFIIILYFVAFNKLNLFKNFLRLYF